MNKCGCTILRRDNIITDTAIESMLTSETECQVIFMNQRFNSFRIMEIGVQAFVYLSLLQ